MTRTASDDPWQAGLLPPKYMFYEQGTQRAYVEPPPTPRYEYLNHFTARLFAAGAANRCQYCKGFSPSSTQCAGCGAPR